MYNRLAIAALFPEVDKEHARRCERSVLAVNENNSSIVALFTDSVAAVSDSEEHGTPLSSTVAVELRVRLLDGCTAALLRFGGIPLTKEHICTHAIFHTFIQTIFNAQFRADKACLTKACERC